MENNEAILMPKDDSCTEKVEPSCEWFEKEVERLILENQKLRKLVDILLEREMR